MWVKCGPKLIKPNESKGDFKFLGSEKLVRICPAIICRLWGVVFIPLKQQNAWQNFRCDLSLDLHRENGYKPPFLSKSFCAKSLSFFSVRAKRVKIYPLSLEKTQKLNSILHPFRGRRYQRKGKSHRALSGA